MSPLSVADRLQVAFLFGGPWVLAGGVGGALATHSGAGLALGALTGFFTAFLGAARVAVTRRGDVLVIRNLLRVRTVPIGPNDWLDVRDARVRGLGSHYALFVREDRQRYLVQALRLGWDREKARENLRAAGQRIGVRVRD